MQTNSLSEFEAEAARFAGALKKGATATVVALSGDLGAGKTTFAQEVAKYFGIPESVTSPTFVIEKIYEIQTGEFKKLIHIDAYRLKESRELEMLGWTEITADSDNLIVLEWPERVSELIPECAHRVQLEFIDENTREISYGS